MINKAIIFDAGTIINFAMNGLLEEFRGLKKIFGGKFIITKEVKGEIIDKPLKIRRFMLEALKIQELLVEKILEMPSEVGVNDDEISEITNDVRNLSNNTFFGNGNAIQIIDLGEASCLALAKLLNDRKIKNVISVDERTTRVLVEKPENLQALLQKKIHTKITPKRENFEFFNRFKLIRSTELIYIAYKRGIVKLKNHGILGALLYALKFHGCSISDEEIYEMERLK